MVTMNMYKKIKNCKNRKMSIRQAAKYLGMSRKTVSKYYKMDSETYVNYITSLEEKTKRFDSCRNEIIEIYLRNEGKIYIFAAVLSASRFRYVAVQPTPFKTIDIIGHLLDCFEYIGGIAEEIVIDQDRALVVSENSGDIILTQKFKNFRNEMGFSLYVCRKADPESKGKVENLVKFVKTSFFSGRRFNSFDEIPPLLDEWLERRANGKVCQSTGIIPRNLLSREQENLNPLRASIYHQDQILDRESRKVSDKSMISFKGSQYSVPREYRDRTIWLSMENNQLILYKSIDGNEIARHNLSLIPGDKVINKHHLRSTLRKASELKQELQKKEIVPLWSEFIEANYKCFNRLETLKKLIAISK